METTKKKNATARSFRGLAVVSLLSAVLFLGETTTRVEACTVFVVGRKASADGSVMCSHSNDGEFDTDPRLVKVSAADYPEVAAAASAGSGGGGAAPPVTRPVYYSPESYPRYVGYERNIPEYYPKEGEHHGVFEPIGHIPQVAHTYAYLEETYGAVNEMQVGIGESTCSGVFGALPIHQHPNGTALFSIDELSRIAMERASTAREAISLMGSLAEAHGFYGAGEFEGTAEALAVTDPREAWIFHILPDPTGKSAIWVAERIDDDAFAIVANMFVIREVDSENTDRFLMSDSVHGVAIDYGWWTSVEKDGLLDFTKIYSDGEYSHKYYTGRRVWAAYRLAAPSKNFPSDYKDLQSDPVYPLSAKPDRPLTERDLFRFHRDTLGGTEFDLSAEGNLAGGAFGTPDRWKAGRSEQTKVAGNWERPIGLYRTSDTYVVQSKEQEEVQQQQQQQPRKGESKDAGEGADPVSGTGAILWFGPSSALATVFTPFVVGMSDVPASFRSGHQSVFSRDSAFWAACYAHNIANLKWSYMIRDIQERQDLLEGASVELVAAIREQSRKTTAAAGLVAAEDALARNADSVVASLWSLSDELVFRYADGFLNFRESEVNDSDGGGEITRVLGYPAWWLEEVGYKDGPPPPPTVPRCCNPPKEPSGQTNGSSSSSNEEDGATDGSGSSTPLLASLRGSSDRVETETAVGITGQ